MYWRFKENNVYVQTKSIAYSEFYSDINTFNFKISRNAEEEVKQWKNPLHIRYVIQELSLIFYRFTSKNDNPKAIVSITFPSIVPDISPLLLSFQSQSNIHTLSLINISKEIWHPLIKIHSLNKNFVFIFNYFIFVYIVN